MTDVSDRQQRSILQRIAHRVMLARGLLPDFSPDALAELEGIHGPATLATESTRDLRNLIWCSIDNDDSRDLDQLTFAEAMPGGAAKILVAIADVDAVVKKQSALDDHARHNTTSVYTAAKIFPMLPEKLSTEGESYLRNGAYFCEGLVLRSSIWNWSANLGRATQTVCPQDAV